MELAINKIAVGIDFGTSNSAAALFDGTHLTMVSLDPGSTITPTAVHLDRDYQTLTGAAAVQRFVDENRGRKVEMVAEVIGQASTSVDDPIGSDTGGANSANIYGNLVDWSLPGRLFLGVKRLLGNEHLQTLKVFEKDFRLVALITPILLKIRQAIAQATPAKVNSVHIGRPVEFEGRAQSTNTTAVSRLQQACDYAGHRNVTFYPEPVAATLSYLFSRRSDDSGTVLTVDFGGGTLDFSLLRYTGADCANPNFNERGLQVASAVKPFQFEVLATHGVAVAGDHIDQLIFRSLVFPELGKGALWLRRVEGVAIETPFPFDDYEQGLLNWTISHSLNQNSYTARLTDLTFCSPGTAVKIARLRDVIQYNLSFTIFAAIKQAKAQLSEREHTVLHIPELDLELPFSRIQLDAIIADLIVDMGHSLTQLLAQAQLPSQAVDRVLRTGGSSNIAAVIALLEQRFPGKVVKHDPFSSVAAGLAIANYYGYTV